MTNQFYTDPNLSMRQPSASGTVTSAHLPPEPLTEFQKFVASTTGQVLPIFGADLFRDLPSTFAPLNLTPVPPSYGIGPGDELRIRIWGHVNLTANQRVDRSGDIFLPQVGVVHVAGLPYSDLDRQLREAVGRIYRNFDLSVNLGDIRAIQVYVTGQARRPGLYTVSSLSSLATLLFSSGGPSLQGSMRHAELKRDGKTLVDFDLYDLLLRGDKSRDIQVLSGDIIFIPSKGPQAAIAGSVGTPAIYELRSGETIGELLKDAGGTSPVASDGRISIDRIEGHHSRIAMEIANDSASLTATVNDGDVLRVLSIVPGFSKTVTLRGNVGSPGRFTWHKGMRLSDIIPDRGSLVTRNYWWKRTQLGLPAPEFEPLEPFANLHQFNAPVELALTPEQQQSSAMGVPAGVGAGEAGMATSEQLRHGADAGQQANQSAPDDAQAPGKAQGELNHRKTSPRFRPENDIQLDVAEIDWNYAAIERFDAETLKTSVVPFDLGRLVQQNDSSQDLELQPGDVVTIFSQGDIHVPLAEQTKFIRIEGEIVHAGIYTAKPGESLRDVIQKAGGLTPDAYLYGSVFSRSSTQIEQQKRIDEYVQKLEMQIQSQSLGVAASAVSSDKDLASAATSQKIEQDLISRLRQVRATGRIVLEFKHDSAGVDSIPNLTLENGDTFLVPPIPSTVNVVGAVNVQSAFLYSRSRRVASYLRLAGGPNRGADVKHAFLIRADGSVVARMDVKDAFGNAFNDLPVHPGDTLVVPEKIFNPTAMRRFMDSLAIFSNLAISAAAISILR
jgi:protein involved in polysaccharide export with SLBB domain